MIQAFLKWIGSLFTVIFIATPSPTPSGHIINFNSVGVSPTPTQTSSPTNTPISIVSRAPTAVSTPTSIVTKPPVSVNNAPPNAGFSKQNVVTENGTFMVNIVVADVNSTTVIVDTASTADCSSNCPTLSLGDFVKETVDGLV